MTAGTGQQEKELPGTEEQEKGLPGHDSKKRTAGIGQQKRAARIGQQEKGLPRQVSKKKDGQNRTARTRLQRRLPGQDSNAGCQDRTAPI
jgi:hypothetical protein